MANRGTMSLEDWQVLILGHMVFVCLLSAFFDTDLCR